MIQFERSYPWLTSVVEQTPPLWRIFSDVCWTIKPSLQQQCNRYTMEPDSDSEETKEHAMVLRFCLHLVVLSPWTARAASKDQTTCKTIVFHCLFPPTCSVYVATSPNISILETCHQSLRHNYNFSTGRQCQGEFENIVIKELISKHSASLQSSKTYPLNLNHGVVHHTGNG